MDALALEADWRLVRPARDGLVTGGADGGATIGPNIVRVGVSQTLREATGWVAGGLSLARYWLVERRSTGDAAVLRPVGPTGGFVRLLGLQRGRVALGTDLYLATVTPGLTTTLDVSSPAVDVASLLARVDA